jgi:hypothetical protein
MHLRSVESVSPLYLPRNGEDMAQRPVHYETNEHGPAQVEWQWGIIMPAAQNAKM